LVGRPSVAAPADDQEAAVKGESNWNLASDPNLKHIQKAADEIAQTKAKQVAKATKARELKEREISDERAILTPVSFVPEQNKDYVGIIFYEKGLFELDDQPIEPGYAFICDIEDLTMIPRLGESTDQPHLALCRQLFHESLSNLTQDYSSVIGGFFVKGNRFFANPEVVYQQGHLKTNNQF
jgi:hypothetical protein